jgi:molybdopterin-guanine dinucleotide biosynthesis protein A
MTRLSSQFHLLINAGGQSERMGRLKALLPVPARDEPLIRYIARRLRPVAGGKLIVVANDPAICEAVANQGAVRCLPDAYPGTGPLGGLATGLQACVGWAVCVACDMPFVQPAIFQYLCRLAEETDGDGRARWDAVVPKVNERFQPMHALYHKRCLPAIQEDLAQGYYRVNGFYPKIRLRIVTEEELLPLDPDLRSFVNVNTPAEWEQAQKTFVDSQERNRGRRR